MTYSEFKKFDGNMGRKFTVTSKAESYVVKIPRELVEDEVGDGASNEEIDNWIEENIESILKSAEAKWRGGFSCEPFDRLIVEEAE